MAAVGPLWHSGALPSRPRGRPLGVTNQFGCGPSTDLAVRNDHREDARLWSVATTSPKGPPHPMRPGRRSEEAKIPVETRHPASIPGGCQRSLNAQSTLRQWAFGVCSTGVARARGGAQAQCIALLAHCRLQLLECSHRLAREDRQLPIGPKPPVSVDCRDDGRFAIARTHALHPVIGTVSADTLAHCFLSSADPSFLSHDRVSSAPCLRAAAPSPTQPHPRACTPTYAHWTGTGRIASAAARAVCSCVRKTAIHHTRPP